MHFHAPQTGRFHTKFCITFMPLIFPSNDAKAMMHASKEMDMSSRNGSMFIASPTLSKHRRKIFSTTYQSRFSVVPRSYLAPTSVLSIYKSKVRPR